MKNLTLSLLALLLVALFACQPDQQSANNNQTDSTPPADTNRQTTSEDDSPEGEVLVYTKYKLPLPVELYRFLKNNNVAYNLSLLNTVEKMEQYQASTQQAINFGIYASSLAYCMAFEQKQDAMAYFEVTKALADKLHIAKGYDQEIIDRLNDNINNNDSLLQIASNSYWEACTYLEENDKINILPFIVAGAWLESLYLSVHTVDMNNPPEKIRHEIANQKQAWENLKEYLYNVMVDSNTFLVNDEVQELGIRLNELKVVYDQINKPEDMTPERFKQLGKSLAKIRDNYIN